MHCVSILTLLLLVVSLSSCTEQESTLPIKKNIEDAVFASGYVEQENNYTISAKAEGILLSFPIKEGDAVDKNQVIASIENDLQNHQLQDALVVYHDAVNSAAPSSPQLLQIQTQIEQAQKQLAFDQDNFNRYEALYEQNSVAKIDYEKAQLQVEAAQNNLLGLQKNYEDVQSSLALNTQRSAVQVSTQQAKLKDYQLSSEVKGTVIQVFKKRGELVRKGEPLAQIGSGDYLIKLYVAEEDITKIELGQEVAVNINTYPNKTFPARVSKIYPGFSEAEQSYIIEAQFEQMPQKMYAGTQLQANVKTNSRADALVIPSEYLNKGSYVMLANGEEKAIETGSKNTEWTEVIAGISENDLIIKPNN